MKHCILVLIASILSCSAFAGSEQVYIAKCDGHRMSFLILYPDSVSLENYFSQMKASVYSCKQMAAKLDKTIMRKDQSMIYEGVSYTLMANKDACGDFTQIFPGFGNLDNQGKLNVCRNAYLCKPRKGYRMSFEQRLSVNRAILPISTADFIKRMK